MIKVFIIISITAIIAVIGTILYVKKIKDNNSNLIPDRIDDIVKEAKHRTERVKQEVDDVAEDIIDAIKGVDDIVDAAKGSKRRGRHKKDSK